MASPPSLITFTALELQEKLQAGSLTSVELTKAYLEQIEKHNKHLNALISVCPKKIVLARAGELDSERQAGRTRSRLHGIPIVDTFVTSGDLGMPTTAGSFVFASMTAAGNAPVIEKLLDAGLLILGKANMTEFCGLKSNNTPVGWSAYGGQTKSPYRRDGLSEAEQPTAGGSSSGSAVSVASGFCPLAIGTETSGSTVYPASLAGLYAMKPTPGRASTVGVFSLSASFDSIGIMARDPQDLAELHNVIIDSDQAILKQAATSVPRSPAFKASSVWDGVSIGVTDVLWGIHETGRDKWGHSHVRATWRDAVEKMRAAGARVVYPMELPEYDIVAYNKQTLHTIAYHEFPSEVAKFAENFEPAEGGTIRSLEDVIHWNKEHAMQALPEPFTTQTELEAAVLAKSSMTEDERQMAVAGVRRLAGTYGLSKAMGDAGVDIVLSASDSLAVGFAGAAGWPIATAPLGNLTSNGQPFGFFAVAAEGREDLLFDSLGAFHATFPTVEQAPLSLATCG
ncbi:glutamyl-tRNA amidotransferase subunit [Colletotrichum plurivorum]|uniref:Glutamyl-tRNA amidotransferase subunit n=1 Tax=Colletotrichum plurivorum TaxID=2175906 RepID=A0A8H6NH38_9PEZI|nr:glutamyl-tRNA amidotransferase subunit [Colletotrichum plurivorum]